MASHELDIADDIEASEYFNLAVLNNGVTLKVSDALDQQAELPPRRNLFAVSNLFGLAIASTNNGFAVFTLSALRQAYTSAKQRTQALAEPLRSVAIGPGGLSFIKIGLADKVVIAAGPALQGGIGVWRLRSLVDGTSTEPLHVFPPASSTPLLDVLPNPGDRPELLALLYSDGHMVMINMDSKATIGTFGEGITAACWSVKGKQIVTGGQNGNLVQFTPEGEPKTGTDAPTSLRGRGVKILDLRWLENTVFFATYCEAENPMDTSIFVTTRAKDGSVTYAPILDPLMVETMDRPEARFNVWMKNWTPFKHLLLVCNATSNTIGHVGLGPLGEGGNNIAWSCIKNDLYTTLPLETYPLGLEIDYTETTVPASEENAGVKPLPLLWSYASDGSLSAWRIVNLQGEQYPSIAPPHDILAQEDAGLAQNAAPSSTSSSAVPPPIAPGASPFAASSPAAAFGSTAFGTGAFSSPPSFGRPASFAAPPSFAPAFGQAPFGTTSAFGKPAFGQPALQPAAAPAKGAFSSFSQQTSAFASPSASGANSPFASSAASPSSTPAFASGQPATFGTSTFGQGGTASGTASMATSPAPAAFGQPSPFGSATSTISPFASAKPASGGFGSFASSSNSKPSSGGFGAFSSTTSTSTPGFGLNTSPAGPQKNAFDVPGPSAFGSIREDKAAKASSTVKPPGLDENDAEDMEPVNTASQKGGALDFDDKDSDDGKQADTLAFGGLGFGGTDPAPAAHASPSAFGGLARPATQTPAASSAFASNANASSPSPFSFKPTGDTSDSKPVFAFAGFGQGSKDSKPGESAASAKTMPDSISKPAGNAQETPAEATNATPFSSFSKASASTEGKKESTATSSPFTGFGKAASFGQTSFSGQNTAFGQTSFGQKPAFATPASSSEKPAFAFGKPASDTGVSGGFAGFASPSPSASKSPFASSQNLSPNVTPAFGQPGLFKGFGQKAASASESLPAASVDDKIAQEDTSESQNSQVPASISEGGPSQVPKSPSGPSPTHASDRAAVTEPPIETETDQAGSTSLSGAVDKQEDKAGVKLEDFSQDEEWNEEEDDYDEEEDEDDEQEVEVENSDQQEEEYGEEAEDRRSETANSEQQDDEAGSQQLSDEADHLDSETEGVDDFGQTAGTGSSPLAAESDESSSTPASPSPSPAVTKSLDSPAENGERSSFSPARSAFSFAPIEDKGLDKPTPASSAAWSFAKSGSDAEPLRAMSNPFAGSGKAGSDQSRDSNETPETAKTQTEIQSGHAMTAQSAAKVLTPAQGPLNAAASARSADSPKPFGLGNLQKATPRTSSPLASMPAYAPPASPSQTQSSFDLSNLPSSPSSPDMSPSKGSSQQPPPFTAPQAKPPPPNFFKQPESSLSDIGASVQQKQSTKDSVARPQQTTAATALSISAPPKLSSSVPQARQAVQVSQDTLNIFITMQDHLDALKESAAACMSFFHSVQPSRLPKEGFAHATDVLAYEAQWGMGDLPRLREATRSLSNALADVAHRAKDEEKAARSLEGSLLKIKAKAEEINRYLRAKEDPQVAKMVRVRQLGPEQLENQNRIRKQTQNVTEALNELERTITTLKDKVLEEKLGRSPLQAPSLDSIYRATRNLTSALQSKVAELDDIGLRLDMMTLSTSSRVEGKDNTPRERRLLGSAAGSSTKTADGSPLRAGWATTPRITTRVERNVQKALAAEDFGQQLKEAWLAKHHQPLFNKTANEASY